LNPKSIEPSSLLQNPDSSGAMRTASGRSTTSTLLMVRIARRLPTGESIEPIIRWPDDSST